MGWRIMGGLKAVPAASAALIVALGLLYALPAGAVSSLDDHDCFSGDNDRRITGCSELIGDPNLPSSVIGSAYAMRALAYSLKGLYDTAIQDYDSAIRLVPDFAVALNNRAWAYFKAGRPSEGLPDVERSLEIQPTSPHSYDTRAHIKQWTGDPAGALRDYEHAMRFGGSRMIRLYQCGLAAHRLFNGVLDGAYTADLRKAMQVCVQTTDCDPLPPDEECRAATS